MRSLVSADAMYPLARSETALQSSDVAGTGADASWALTKILSGKIWHLRGRGHIAGTFARVARRVECLMETPAESGVFYSGALERIRWLMIVIAVVGTIGALLGFGLRTALGVVLGCAIAYLNFHWLKRVVTAMAERITSMGKAQSGKGIVFRFCLRYVLMGLAAYAILSVSPASLYGLFAGLFLPVVAIAYEAGYEVYIAVARGL